MESSRPHRVLCVDDDEDACEMLSVLLKHSNIDASCVKSAGQAWELMRAHNFDLYLLDTWLPGLDGFELCRQIRAVDQYTPILFYSAAAYDKDKRKGLEAGANAYLTKPHVDVLLRTIMNLVHRPVKALAAGNAEWRRDASSGQFTFSHEDRPSRFAPSLGTQISDSERA
ncbi:MAG: response regulator [Acidobacteriota bacterium]|nr:response regulator [Acidobacteriota bacterium]